MLKRASVILATAIALGASATLAVPGARAATIYQLDDGASETAFGLAGPGDLMWLNAFTTPPGGQQITGISLTWGSPAITQQNQLPNGLLAELLLYQDPNNDGNPNDAILLTSQATTVTFRDQDIFSTININPTQMSGSFFVAALIRNLQPNQFAASLDTTNPIPNRSWIVSNFPNELNTTNLSTNLFFSQVENLVAGNWLLRAIGTPLQPPPPDHGERPGPEPIPEPATWLGLLGVGALASRLRRRAH